MLSSYFLELIDYLFQSHFIKLLLSDRIHDSSWEIHLHLSLNAQQFDRRVPQFNHVNCKRIYGLFEWIWWLIGKKKSSGIALEMLQCLILVAGEFFFFFLFLFLGSKATVAKICHKVYGSVLVFHLLNSLDNILSWDLLIVKLKAFILQLDRSEIILDVQIIFHHPKFEMLIHIQTLYYTLFCYWRFHWDLFWVGYSLKYMLGKKNDGCHLRSYQTVNKFSRN